MAPVDDGADAGGESDHRDDDEHEDPACECGDDRIDDEEPEQPAADAYPVELDGEERRLAAGERRDCRLNEHRLSDGTANLTIMAKRGKKRGSPSTSATAASGSGSDRKRLERAFRALGLVDSRQKEDHWYTAVAASARDSDVDEWTWQSFADIEDAYDYNYATFERARYLALSWRSYPLKVECDWMLPRLRSAIGRQRAAGVDEPFLLELGAGPGGAAALLSAALQVPVIAVDSHPSTLGLPEQFSALTGGQVRSVVADAADLADVLEGRIPAAVYAMGTFRYVLGHNHVEGHYSDSAHMRRLIDSYHVSDGIGRMIDAFQGADVLSSEVGCPDFTAELAAALASRGYWIAQDGIARALDMHTPNMVQETTLTHFTTNPDNKSPKQDLLLAMSEPLPQPKAGLSIKDSEVAEALRLTLQPSELVLATEIVFADGSGTMRWELFLHQDMVGTYKSTTGGYREINLYQLAALEKVTRELAEQVNTWIEAGQATATELNLPATLWT